MGNRKFKYQCQQHIRSVVFTSLNAYMGKWCLFQWFNKYMYVLIEHLNVPRQDDSLRLRGKVFRSLAPLTPLALSLVAMGQWFLLTPIRLWRRLHERCSISYWTWSWSWKKKKEKARHQPDHNIGILENKYKEHDTYIHIKIWITWLYRRVMSPNDAAGMANNVRRPWSGNSLIWLYTICTGLSVRKPRIITVLVLCRTKKR